jgi:hypothetical protein
LVYNGASFIVNRVRCPPKTKKNIKVVHPPTDLPHGLQMLLFTDKKEHVIERNVFIVPIVITLSPITLPPLTKSVVAVGPGKLSYNNTGFSIDEIPDFYQLPENGSIGTLYTICSECSESSDNSWVDVPI